MNGVLTRRLLLVATVGLAVVFLSQVVTTTLYTLPVFGLLERDLDQAEVRRAQSEFDRRLETLISYTLDYAVWDDSVAFVEQGADSAIGQAYVKSNFPPETAGLRIDGFLYADAGADHWTHVTFDPTVSVGTALHPFDRDALDTMAFVRRGDNPYATLKHLLAAGYASVDGHLISFASAEVMPSDGQGRSRGYLVLWHYLQEPVLQSIRQAMQRPIEFVPLAGAYKTQDHARTVELLEARAAGAFLPRDDDDRLSWLIRSPFGSPLLLVRQAAPPRLFPKTWWSTPFLAAFGTSAMALIIIGYLISRMVIAPLLRADQALRDVIRSMDYSVRLKRSGWGEVGQLLDSINQLLDRISTQNASLQDQNTRLEELSQKDALTGVANRRHLDNELDAAWARAARNRSPIAVAMVDVDHFKTFNDQYGHQSGDLVLREVARTLRDHVHGATDVIGRYGGEEFCVILGDTLADEAVMVGERMRKAIETLEIPHQGSASSPYLTVSVGVSSAIPDSIRTAGELVREADHALYEAKAAGRNCVRRHDSRVRLMPVSQKK